MSVRAQRRFSFRYALDATARLSIRVLFGVWVQSSPELAGATDLTADFSVPAGRIRPLHGINKGPLVPGGLVDLTREQRALGIPFTRLHDCGWPNPYVVDHHAVFPNSDADPTLPESYDFRLTDEYLEAVRKTGSEPIYRLGESIEHTGVKRFVHPPANPEKWAAVCLGIIRHYNEGWANGFHDDIRYWEIWNEPENRPAMWSGTDDDYLRLYEVTATAIRKQFPNVKVGGPALGASGNFVNGEFVPTEFATRFLIHCRKTGVPLNFFSWHCYTANPSELTARSRAIRRLLDSHGFTDTESHLNEWNYLPGNTWSPVSRSATPAARQQFYEEMSGAPGAAFLLVSLLELQDAPVDVCNLFHGEVGGFGLFSEQGVPSKAYQALRGFHALLETPLRVETRGAIPGRLGFAAGLSRNGREATLLVSNYSDARTNLVLHWKGFSWTGGVVAEIRTVDVRGDGTTVRTEILAEGTSSLPLALAAPALAQVRLRPALGGDARETLAVHFPANRLVFQRSLSGSAEIPIHGTCAWPGVTVESRWVDVASGVAGPWTALGTVRPDFTFGGSRSAAGGWYTLEVRARRAENTVSASVERVGVGEVFVVVGHSVAHGGSINLPGAEDDRVNTFALPSDDLESRRRYDRTGDPQYLPDPVGRHFDSEVRPAPAGNGTYLWAAFADHVARAQNVPVLVLNAAFGGTSLEHWAKSSRGEPFEHGFVNASLRMPYVRLQHALRKYCAVLGLRAVLADQGQNDWREPSEETIFENYRAWMDQARRDAGFPELALVVNRQSPPGGDGQVRRVQERMIRVYPHCFPGPNYDALSPEDTTDRIHLSEAGARKAARLWAGALDDAFFKAAVPWLPSTKTTGGGEPARTPR